MTTTSVATLAELKTALAAAATNGQADTITLTADISAVDGADFTAGTGGRDLVKIAITDGETLSIVGGGFALDANYFGRVLEVSSGTVAISDLTIREGGLAGDGFEGQANGGAALGAGLYNSANLTLANVSVTLNAASGGGGGYGGAYGGGGGGGGGAGSVAGKGGNGASTVGYPASGGTGGAGGPGNYYPTTDGGGGGSSQGGAGGLYGSARAGAGGTAQAGLLSVGGGGGGAGGGITSGDSGVGGAAVGGLYNSASGVLRISGGAITGNVGAGGGGGATAGPGRDAAGGIAVGGLWNAGYLSLDSVTLSGNAAGGGFSAADGHTDSYANSHSTGVVNSAPTGSVAISGTSAQGQVLTASNTLADVNGLGTINYQWKSDGAVISGATASTFTLTQAYVGHVITVTGSYTDSLGQAESVTSSGTTSVANVNDAPTGSVSIAGTATQGQVLTASNTLADLDGLGTISYQWKSDGAAISGATAATFTLTQAQVGQAITVTARYTDGGGFAESVTSTATSAVAAPGAPTTDVATLAELKAALAAAAGDGIANTITLTANISATGAGDFVNGTGGPDLLKIAITDGQTLSIVGGGFTLDANHLGRALEVSSGTVAISDLTIREGALAGVGGDTSQDGGAALGGGIYNAGNLTLTNVTVTANAAAGGGGGGGGYVSGGGGGGGGSSNDSGSFGNFAGAGGAGYGDYTAFPGSAGATSIVGAGGAGGVPPNISLAAAHGGSAFATSSTGGLGGSYVAYNGGLGGAASVGGSGGLAAAGGGGGAGGGYDSSGLHEPVGAGGAAVGGIYNSGTLVLSGGAVTRNAAAGGGGGANNYSSGTAYGGTAVGGIYNAGVLSLNNGASVTNNVGSGGASGYATTPVLAASSTNFSGVAANVAHTGIVTIAGTATQGQVLTASNTLADTNGLGIISYQWKSDGTNISGATASTFTLTQAQVGHLITTTASFTDGGGALESQTSAATSSVANLNDAPTGSVSIAGTATQGQTLTAANTLADVDGLGAISYQWKSDGVAISGATATTFTLTEAQVGHVVTVTAGYTDGFSNAESVTSSGTASVANVNDAPTGAVTISGTATQAQTLTTTNTLADADGLGTVSYQWKADGSVIAGATASTLVLAPAQLGKAISVVASYVDGHGTAESVASAATAIVGPIIVEPDPEPETPPTTTTSTVVDGVIVGVVTVANFDGSVTRTMTIPTVLTAADGRADIPLLSRGGQTVLAVSAPSGFGLTVDGSPTPTTAAASASDMVRAVSAHSSAADQSQLIASGQAYLATLPGATPVIVQSLTLSLTAQAATAAAPLVINGSPAVAGGPVTLLIIDARGLPSGATLELHNVDFASISGAVRVTGGTGSQTAFGDNSAQYIVLGADDDVLHGGGGNDTIGSKGGNDKLYGDAGDDTLFGGAGDDLMDGGTGYDTVLLEGKLTDYHFTHSSTGMRIFGFEGDDAIVNIEALKTIDGQIVTKLADLVDGTTSVAVLTYQFFTGKTPTGVGLDFLLHAPDTVNAHDLTDAYYQGFNLENRYINFAVNLASVQGQGHAWFEQAYGGLTMSQTVAKAYLEIFGAAATSQKVDAILLADVGGQTRQAYFEAVAGAGDSAKAAVIGWLLGEAAKSDLGRYAEANNAFLADFMDGSAHLNVDLIGTYGSGATWIL